MIKKIEGFFLECDSCGKTLREQGAVAPHVKKSAIVLVTLAGQYGWRLGKFRKAKNLTNSALKMKTICPDCQGKKEKSK